MVRHRPRESYPPPLFVAELDTAPVHGSVTSPEGGLAFEMPGESAPVRGVSDEPERRPARTTEVDENVQANPWPFYLDQEVRTAGGGAPKEEDAKEGEVEQANPWPYHGPASGDDAPSATIYPQAQQQQGPQKKESLHGLGGGADEAALQESLKHPGQAASPYPAPLRVSRPSSAPTASPPPGIKPYSAPPGRDVVSAVGLGVPLSGAPPKSPIQGLQSPGVPYRPYRPPSTSSASGATVAQSPSVMGMAPHHFYTPLSSDSEPMSPAKQRPDVVPDMEDKVPGQGPSTKPYSPPPPPPPPPAKDDSPAASTESPAQDAAYAPATNTSRPQSPSPVTMAHAQAPLAQPSPSVPGMTPVSAHHTASPGMPPSPASSYDIQQSTYAPSPSLSPLPRQTRPQVAHASTDSSHTGHTPASPPPAYLYPGPGGPDSQPTPQGQQHPPYSPPPPSPYPPQPKYAASTGQQNPPLPGGKPPPPLPPRRPNVSCGGFGGGPSNAANFPPPPKTHYNPMRPPYPPRPLGSGMSSTSLFSASSARKWLDKTSQVLESKLESVLQGPQGPAYRPAYMSGPPPQAYSNGPRTRGMPPAGYNSYGPGPWGPGPAPPPPPPGWRGPP
ncbi:hypothetical protein MAC_00805 [Metarhizium acridum CQMa 102]|uniref:Uncharacterized protein n=1 Tax=Metarhizium acridum (strain CQMa 102) TaxID=655827 RepID=E9DTG7_METAQ|nr:uncharacterized protein MAC_00805 [Metarhizium acridum CQMa 102]EFY93022.1 hypothetical protein MAC_00805 [Metarhizium acridum CQMa 102]